MMTQTKWSLTEEWAFGIYRAVDTFLEQTNVTKTVLARALGMHAGSLSLSALRDQNKNKYIYQRLPYALSRERLFGVAHALRLDLVGYRALRRLAGDVLSLNTGYFVNPDHLMRRRDEAVEVGLLGASYFADGQWSLGVPCLEHSWSWLTQTEPDSNASDFQAVLTVGTRLTDWQSYAGLQQEALRSVKRLLGWVKRYSGTDTGVIDAICRLYIDAGVVYR